MITTIAFDYGGVIELGSETGINKIRTYLGIEKIQWDKMYFTLNHLCNIGNATFEDVLVLTSQKLGATDEQVTHIRVLLREIKASKRLNAPLIEKIKILRENYTLVLLSNYNLSLRGKLEQEGLLDIFDQVIISSEVGYQKPQPEIFKILCDRCSITMDQLVFVDDKKKSLETAPELGYTPILYENNQQLFEDLKNKLNK